MKVVKRILIKIVILVLVIGLSAGTAAGIRGYRQSTAQYAIDTYASYLIDNNTEKAYVLLDQSENDALTKEEYQQALQTGKYSLYASYEVKEAEKRLDQSGNEYTDYHVKFLDAAGEVQKEEDFTAKKQATAFMGIFDRWKILSEHCMIKNFELTVPTGAEVYLDSKQLDASWIVREDTLMSYDRYQIPTLIPGTYQLVIRHPAFESVNTTLDTGNGAADYTASMTLKTAAQDTCKELGVKALKQWYTSAATEKTESLKEVFADCLKDVQKQSKKQAKEFHKEEADFKQAAISGFSAQFNDVVYTEEKNGAITVEMTFSYHYAVRDEVSVDTGTYDENGSSIWDTETQEKTGDATAKFTMAFYDAEWHIAACEMPVIPES